MFLYQLCGAVKKLTELCFFYFKSLQACLRIFRKIKMPRLNDEAFFIIRGIRRRFFELVQGRFRKNNRKFEDNKKRKSAIKCGFAIVDPERFEHAPFAISGIQGTFDCTRICSDAMEICTFACRNDSWDAREDWETNMRRLYKSFPSRCFKWKLLEDYFEPNRGGVVGKGFGILRSILSFILLGQCISFFTTNK